MTTLWEVFDPNITKHNSKIKTLIKINKEIRILIQKKTKSKNRENRIDYKGESIEWIIQTGS